jgi:hypothetical protein
MKNIHQAHRGFKWLGESLYFEKFILVYLKTGESCKSPKSKTLKHCLFNPFKFIKNKCRDMSSEDFFELEKTL